MASCKREYPFEDSMPVVSKMSKYNHNFLINMKPSNRFSLLQDQKEDSICSIQRGLIHLYLTTIVLY